METISWLIDIACRHEALRKEHAENPIIKDMAWSPPDLTTLSSKTIPPQLASLSQVAIQSLAHFVKQKISGVDKILGHEVINALLTDKSLSPLYLQALDDLKRAGWLELTPDSDSLMKLRPWCWLQARIEMGQLLLCVPETSNTPANGFESNEEYLDAVVEYIDRLAERLKSNNQTLCSDEVHQLPDWIPDQQFKEIEARLLQTKVSVTAAEIRSTLKLSGWQYLFFMGILGSSENVVKYDFSFMTDVLKLFASGYNVRRMMREHLVGKESPLIRHGLIENSDGFMWSGTKPTAKAIRLITGKKIQSKSIEEIKTFASKETVFDVERPKMKKNALMLPAETMESIMAIIYAEKPAGRKLRAVLEKHLPSAVGCPTGSTVLLYGPPGTGKTLTASYLASELNVPILKVDCAKILGMYVSENEKNTKRIFDDYATMCKMLNKRAVLLLNEADQLLGERLTPTSAHAQSNNNMQNLFLEALERFDGILIATTNRKELLDEAYSRRFTYKLELLPPDLSTRRMLWESHLPQDFISGKIDMGKLASYPLTGGEIRLVLEQAVRKAAYNGCTKLDGTMLLEIAGKEAFACNGKHIRNIGFGAV
jgi:AAA+ superfamily predicted ATPase